MGIFSKLAQGLKKTKEAIAKKFYSLFTGRALDEEFYEDLENVLISSDMGVEATEQILERFKEECYEKRISKAEDARQLLKDIMTESIDYEVAPYEYPLIILVAGVNGVGKTTAIGKMAKYFKSQGKSVVMAAADTFRAAAGEQLEVWSQRAGVRLIKHEEGSDPAAVVFDALSSAKAKGTDVVLIDTAGRLHNKKGLMDELSKMRRTIEKLLPGAPHETFLTIDASLGLNAISQAREFAAAANVTGLVLTKLDGTGKGGAAAAVQDEFKLPVLFVGLGEGAEDLQPFSPEDYARAVFAGN